MHRDRHPGVGEDAGAARRSGAGANAPRPATSARGHARCRPVALTLPMKSLQRRHRRRACRRRSPCRCAADPASRPGRRRDWCGRPRNCPSARRAARHNARWRRDARAASAASAGARPASWPARSRCRRPSGRSPQPSRMHSTTGRGRGLHGAASLVVDRLRRCIRETRRGGGSVPDASLPVIGMAGEDLLRAVELFEQHVRAPGNAARSSPRATARCRRARHRVAEPVGAADREGERRRCRGRASARAGSANSRLDHDCAALVERDEPGAGRQRGEDQLGLARLQLRAAAGGAFPRARRWWPAGTRRPAYSRLQIAQAGRGACGRWRG